MLEAALAVIDRSGLDACTMRAVATELGVEAMSLYWHVENKEDLLDGVVQRVLADIAVPADEPTEWRDRMVAFAGRFRALLLEHPNVVPLLAKRSATAYTVAKRAAVVSLQNLERAGFSATTAIDITRMFVRFVFGFTMVETAQAQVQSPSSAGAEPDPELRAFMESVTTDDPQQLFDLGLEIVLAGIEAKRAGS